ncbi:MAG TPA: S26 family signal peptidase [Thermoplasmata archaeon]|nr:S26 family signal peptidase [Thermoplasmata archaeon]
MARRPTFSDDEEEEAPEAEGEDESSPPPRHRRSPSSRGTGHAPVRAWKGADEGEGEEDDDEEPGPTGKRPVYWRARDSLWFEPLVALAIVVLLIVGLYAYTQNWPPVYVVESMSMQHGTDDHLGLINTGDLVLAQKIDPGLITTYVDGEQNGYSTYGEYGDVILYHPDDDTGVSPVIHRAIIYLEYNTDGSWNAPSLGGLTCTSSSHPYYRITGVPSGCGSLHLTTSIILFNVGWQSATVSIPLGGLGTASGFITMGDNNYIPGTPAQGEPDQFNAISALVQPGWVLGVARGMIPWFGAIKLLLEGQSSMVPPQSWQLMGVTLAAILLAALGLHLALRRGGSSGGEEDPEEPPGESLGGRFRGWFHRHDDEAGEDDDDTPAGPKGKQVKPIPKEKLLRRHRGKSGGRPRPSVRRSSGSRSARDSSSDSL